MPQILLESISDVSSVLKSHQAKRIFLVVDEVAYQASGAGKVLDPVFQHYETTWFVKFELNPKLEDVLRGIEAYRNCQPDFVIALGGGTAIDVAKLISLFAAQTEPALEIATGKASIEVPGKSLMAIPTTAGTGSEATHFAVVYVDGKKKSVAHPLLLPRIAVVDWELTTSLPQRMTAASGLDALCQAVESIWSVGSTEESIQFATEAIELAIGNLVIAANSPTIESRKAMCLASHLAGKSINITKTTAPHALSYNLTSKYGVPHGMAVAISLPSLLAFNSKVTDADCMDPRGVESVRNRISQILDCLGTNNVDHAAALITGVLTQLDCPRRLRDAGVETMAELEAIVDSVNVERLSNNPRHASRNQLLNLLKSMF